MSILETAYSSVSADSDKTNVALALVYGYDRLRKYDKGGAVASKLQNNIRNLTAHFAGTRSSCVRRGGLAKLTLLPVRTTPKCATLRRR